MRKRPIINYLPVVFIFFLNCTSATKDAVDAAELVVNNAKIYTVNKNQPEAGALAVKGGKIIFIGSNSEVKKLFG